MCFKTDADDDRAQAYCLALLDHSAILAELIRREAELVDYCSEGSDDDGEEDANSARTSFYKRRAQEALVLYAPMAHTMRVGKSFWQYEDAALKLLVPSSYAGLEKVGETRERERERGMRKAPSCRRLRVFVFGSGCAPDGSRETRFWK